MNSEKVLRMVDQRDPSCQASAGEARAPSILVSFRTRYVSGMPSSELMLPSEREEGGVSGWN